MKTRMILGISFCILLTLWIAGCNPAESEVETDANQPVEVAEVAVEKEEEPTETPTMSPTPTADPAVATVQEHIALVNAGDYAGAVELMADDVMAYFIGMPPIGMEIYWGRDQYQTFLEECCTDQHFEMEVVPVEVEDGMVFTESKTWMDFTRELGVAPNSFYEIYRVEDGLITLYVSTMTEEALANFRPALAEVMPEAFAALVPPDVTGVTAATAMTVTIENGTCTYDSPLALKSGELIVHTNVVDDRYDKYAVSFFSLDEGKDLLDLMASSYRPGPPEWMDMVFLKELDPGESQTYENLLLKEGLLYLVCWAEPQSMPIGNGGPFVVVP